MVLLQTFLYRISNPTYLLHADIFLLFPNRFHLHFEKDSRAEVEKRKKQSMQPFVILPEVSLGQISDWGQVHVERDQSGKEDGNSIRGQGQFSILEGARPVLNP